MNKYDMCLDQTDKGFFIAMYYEHVKCDCSDAEITEKITQEQVDALNELAFSFTKKGEKC